VVLGGDATGGGSGWSLVAGRWSVVAGRWALAAGPPRRGL